MVDTRERSFPLYPSKLLGAFAGMRPEEGYVYWIICLRIYEVEGPCRDSEDALARRTGLPKKRVVESLESLISTGKLVRDGDGLMNEFAREILTDEKCAKDLRKEAGKNGASVRWKKDKEIQSNDDGNRIASASNRNAALISTISFLDTSSESKKGKKKKDSENSSRRGAPLPADWKPTDEDISYGVALGMSRARIEGAAEDMRLWAAANANHAKARKLDWTAAFRGWLRRESVKPERFNSRSGGQNGKFDDRSRAGGAADPILAAARRRMGSTDTGAGNMAGAPSSAPSSEGVRDTRGGSTGSPQRGLDLDVSTEPAGTVRR